MRVGVVGLGNWGVRICESIGRCDPVEIVRGMDVDKATAEAAATRFGFPLCDSYEDLLADPNVEGVILVTPPSGHPEQVLQAAAAGKHVLCEKPLALRRADAVRMVEACESRGLVLGIDHERRFEPGWEELQRVVKSGKLGTLLHVEGNHSHSWMGNLPRDTWRGSKAEGAAAGLTGMGVHIIDVLVSLLGPASQVFAVSADRVHGFENGDVFSTQLRWPDGTTGTITNLCATPTYARIAVFGSQGWIEVREQDMLSGARTSHCTLALEGQEPQLTVFSPGDEVQAAVSAWADSVENGTAYRYLSSELIGNIAAYEAIGRSISSGAPEAVEN